MSKILVIDDDIEIQGMIQRLLERAGFEVLLARDGIEGLEAFVAASPELVITDLLMPRMKGIEAIRKIRKINTDTKILAISGGGRHSPNTLLKRAQSAGATEILSKPFNPSDLLSAVNRLT